MPCLLTHPYAVKPVFRGHLNITDKVSLPTGQVFHHHR